MAQWLAKDRKGYWAYEPNEANRANIQEKKKSSVLIILN